MENRFGVKDLVVVVLLVGVLGMLGLKMIQDDRQWVQFGKIQESLSAQSKQLRTLNDHLAAGISIAPPPGTPGTPAATASNDPYARRFGNEPAFRGILAARAKPDYDNGDWMVETFSATPPKLNDLTAQDLYSRVVFCRVMEPLCGYDISQAKVAPVLATHWEHAKDGLSTVVHLRRGVTFSTGDPFTADDVVHTYNLNMNDKISDGRTREYLRNIVKVEKLDDFTVKFSYGQIHYENFGRATEMNIHSKRFLSKFTDDQIREHVALLVGTGPYKLPDPMVYKPGDPIAVVRNESYWGVPGPWDRIMWKIIQEEKAEELEFRNGELDMVAAQPEQHESMLKDPKLLERAQYHVYEHLRSSYSYIAWNQMREGKPTVFADKRVRQAMSLLIDRERVVRDLWLGYAVVTSGPFSERGRQADPAIKPWPYDMAAGVAKLKEAGFTVDASGRMLQPDGKPFDIELTYGSGSELIKRIALLIKDNLARAGVNLKLNPLDWPVMLDRLDQKNFDAITLSWGGGNLETDIEQMFHSRCIKDGDNRNSYVNPELDKLIEQAHVTLDEDKRLALWRRCHAILHEDQPYTFMIRSKVRLWVDKRVQNVKPLPVFGINYVTTWPVALEWYVPSQQQKRK